MEVARPSIIDVSAEVEAITRREMKIRVGDYVVFLKRMGRKTGFWVWGRGEGTDVVLYGYGSFTDPREISMYELDDNVRKIIEFYAANWEYFLMKREAEIMLYGRIKVVPREATDKELLAMEIAKRLIEDHDVGFLKLKMGGSLSSLGIHCYEEGVWRECRDRVKTLIRGYLENMQALRTTKTVVDEILNNKIELLASRILEPTHTPLIAFENGVFNWEKFLETGSPLDALTGFDKNLYVFHKIPHQLNTGLVKELREGLETYLEIDTPPTTFRQIVALLQALSPKAYKLLESWAWFEDITPELLESRIAFLLEMIGRAMLPGYRVFGAIVFKDIFALLGPPNSGKSTFLLKLLGDLVLGRENYAATRLRYLGSANEETLWRTLGKLYNKLAVIAADVGRRDRVSDWSIIRSIAGGDIVTGRRLYGNPFDYYPAYKLYIGSNDPPKIKEEGEARKALLKRFKVIEFKNTFEEKEFRLDSLLAEQDIEALIICSLYALRLAYHRGSYSYTGIMDVEDALERYSNPSYALVMELVEKGRLKMDKDLKIKSADLYNLVIEYAEKKAKQELGEEAEEEEEEKPSITEKIPDPTQFTKELKASLARYGVKTRREKGYTFFVGLGEPRRQLL